MEAFANPVISLIADLGAMGFILYLVHRTTTHTIPRLADSYMQGEAKQRADFKDALRSQREDFLSALEREREVQNGQADRIIDAIREIKKQ